MIMNLFVINQVSHTLEHIQRFTLRDEQDYRIMSISAMMEGKAKDEEIKQ